MLRKLNFLIQRNVWSLRVRSNTSSRTGIGGGAKFYSVRLVVLTVLELSVQF